MGESISQSAGATVLPFVRRRRPSGLNVSERIAALRWAEAARPFGVRDVRIHDFEEGDEPGLGGFMLIYLNDDMWASWGIASRAGRYEVWRPGSGATVGWFSSLPDALAAIRSVA